MTERGIYLHIPFCKGKCPYCDFYSLSGDEARMEEYVSALTDRIATAPRFAADTAYFGGGTPSLLGAVRIARLLNAVKAHFELSANAEITLEANPGDELRGFFEDILAAGVNRISLGMQSANDNELRALGRRHTAAQTEAAVKAAREAGFENISLDLMLAIPQQTKDSLRRSIERCAELGANHVSAYLLKIEENTPFYKAAPSLGLPCEDEAAELYLFAVDLLAERGYRQYEISNFAKPGFEGRHNLHYWRAEEYLGFGPAAHSFYKGKRFFYPRDLSAFLSGGGAVDDGEGGSMEETILLALRLTEGISKDRLVETFGEAGNLRFEALRKDAAPLMYSGFLTIEGDRIALTKRGFLLSNAVIAKLLA